MGTRKISVRVDVSVDMAQVCLDDEVVMTGNFWDFHPSCNGIHKWGDWNGYMGLTSAIEAALLKEGHTVEVVRTDSDWTTWNLN